MKPIYSREQLLKKVEKDIRQVRDLMDKKLIETQILLKESQEILERTNHLISKFKEETEKLNKNGV